MLWGAAAVAAAGSVVASMLPTRFPARRFLSGMLGASGSMRLWFALRQAGSVPRAIHVRRLYRQR